MVKNVWDRIIDTGSVFVIAEAGINHNGNLSVAKKLVDEAFRAGADAVKFQTFFAKDLAVPGAPKADYQKQSGSADESQLDMLSKLELKEGQWLKLYEYCREKGIIFMSTPFDNKSVELLDGLGMEVFKISSGEITNIPFLSYVASKKKPVILSTGMSTLAEVEAAVKAIKNSGIGKIVLLHCVSNYPARAQEVNLKAMLTLKEKFGFPVGYSDHTLGIDITIAAVALGASVIEKHFTLKCDSVGPDHKISLEPGQLQSMIKNIHRVKIALGDGQKRPVSSEEAVAKAVRKSLVAACDIKAGTVLEEGFIAIKRPGTGLPPAKINGLIGRQVKLNITKGTLLSLEMLI
ncbi:MAG: N-acetylneuraminate synthase [Candidatus Omnitrophica bacterium]|nr:N-acetylneuraminate synthase [Candidatus Omnitrophota bacterium]MDD5429927.1 N-acetylneuraminate synthase [Candidatus Omnitrophota bacterium]